jgi:hypothetical protein
MKKIILLSIICLFAISGCDSDKYGSTSKKKKTNIEDCISPNNPYNDGGGNDAGFNWAVEKGGTCDGDSDSFNEGCTEYYRQLNEYKECVANSHK